MVEAAGVEPAHVLKTRKLLILGTDKKHKRDTSPITACKMHTKSQMLWSCSSGPFSHSLPQNKHSLVRRGRTFRRVGSVVDQHGSVRSCKSGLTPGSPTNCQVTLSVSATSPRGLFLKTSLCQFRLLVTRGQSASCRSTLLSRP